jgi:hypothetical protein
MLGFATALPNLRAGLKGAYPKWVPIFGKSRGPGGAIKDLSEQLGRARTANRARKIKDRIDMHRNTIIEGLFVQIFYQAGKAVVNKAVGDERKCNCEQ